MQYATFGRIVAAVFLSLSLSCRAAPGVGDIPPGIVGTDVDGRPVSLATDAGKAIVVTFWATWCPYCLKELPILEGIQKAAGADQIRVIAVNIESREVFRKSTRALSGLSLQFAHDTGREGSKAFGVDGIPHMVIIGRDGRIQRVYQGYNESQLDGIVADINAALAVRR
jgi:thiol-disulfide isomerase/thioredoxin